MMFSRELPTHLVTRRSVVLALASDHRHGCGAQVEGLGKFPVRREVAENTDIGEHHLGGKFRRFPAEQRRQAALRVTARPFGGAVGDDLAFQNLVPACQRKRYHSKTCSASLQDVTGNVVSKNRASPPGSSSSLT